MNGDLFRAIYMLGRNLSDGSRSEWLRPFLVKLHGNLWRFKVH
jgi:hypothetical protein